MKIKNNFTLSFYRLLRLCHVSRAALFCSGLFLIFAFCILPQRTNAAVLYLEPSSGDYFQEDLFGVDVKIDTQGKEINAVKADLIFSQELLEIKDFSQGNSILIFWAERPSFSNQKGIVSFVGGVPGGYQGNGFLGKIIFKASVKQFKAEEAEARVEFLESSQVLLNDGLGTTAELKTKEATFNIFPEALEFPKDEWRQELEKDKIRPESFKIIVAQDSSMFEGKYFIVFSAIDKQTGIDYYEVKESERAWKRAESPYLLEDQSLKGKILVKAVDKAGNERVAEYMPSRNTFSYWIIITFLALVIIFLVRKRNMKPEA